MCYNLAMVGKKRFKLKFKFNKRISKRLIVILIMVSVGALLFNLKSLFLAAMVNGRPITRCALDRRLEKQAGKAMLENQITEILILQVAKREKIKVNQEEIEEKIAEIKAQFEAQGADLDNLLEAQGQTRKDLENQIKIQLIIEKILGKDIEVADEEVAEYFETNKEFFSEGATLEGMRVDLQQELYQRKLGEKLQPWLIELKDKAKVFYFLKF